MAAKEEYPFPEGTVLNESLCRRFNEVVGYLDDRFPLRGLYRAPQPIFHFGNQLLPSDLIELYEGLNREQLQAVRQVYGRVINYITMEAKELANLGGIVQPEELFPNLEYGRRLTPVGLDRAALGRRGRLFFYHSIKKAP